MLRERVEKTIQKIGLDELTPPIFYNCPIGLRFEIGNPSILTYQNGIPSSEYIQEALGRVSELFEQTHCEFDILLWRMYPQDFHYSATQLTKFTELMQWQAPEEQVTKAASHSDDGETAETISCYWDLQLQHLNTSTLFREIIMADLGYFAELCSSVFLFDTKEHLLFYLYDDRGLDIVAEKKETLFPLYRDYTSWLLGYDRKRMDAIFKE